MKYLNLLLLFFCCLFSSTLFAQTPKQIEKDLLQLFKKIDYWRDHAYDTTINVDVKYTSLKNANTDFAKKLKLYAEKYPDIAAYPFKSLTKNYYYLNISTSSDKMFRIYSWNTWTGGEGHFYENVITYKSSSDSSYKVIIDSTKSLGDNRPNYNNLLTFTVNDKAYYLAVYLYINSETDWVEGARIYTIENERLVEVKLIKTDSDIRTDISCKVHSYSYGRPKIRFDDARKVIYLPLVDENYHFNHKFVTYKFTGQYFERVKN